METERGGPSAGDRGGQGACLVLLLARDRSPTHVSLCRSGDLLEGSRSISQNLSKCSVVESGECW